MPTDFCPSLRNVTPSSFESREPLAILDFHIALYRFFGIICSEEFLILDNVTFWSKLVFWNLWEIILLLIFLHKMLVFLSSLLQSPTCTCESWGEEVCRIKRGREKRCLIFIVFDILSNILPTLTLSVSCWHWPKWEIISSRILKENGAGTAENTEFMKMFISRWTSCLWLNRSEL